MSMSGSISRKRVGSVSQRNNESGLPPLDIQSIQMPSNKTNALALKTAALSSTKSLYQTCSILRKRLRCVEDFQAFLEQPASAEPLDVVSHMCHLFRLGSPLCHLYNLLIPSFTDPSSPLHADLPAPPPIEYDLPPFIESPNGVRDWAKRPENAKMCQRYIASFCMAMKKRHQEGRWHSEMWALHELWGKSNGDEIEAYDSTGLMKVLHTVEEILDHLPESAISPLSPTTPHTASSSIHMSTAAMRNQRQSYDLPFTMGGNGTGSGAIANMAATMNGGVQLESIPQIPNGAANGNGSSSPTTMTGGEDMQRTKSTADANAFKSVEELVSSEKSYVQELEILVRCSQEMLEKQLVSTETNHQIFSNLAKILDFHRKFLIKLETEYEPIQEGRGPKAWAEGVWGRPFITSEAEFDCYGPYCANYLDAITIVNEQMPNLMRGQELPPAERPCLDPQRELQAFMIKPIQRITKYGLLLDAILHATAKHEYPFRPELEEASAAVKRIAASINEVTDFKAKQATVRELMDRVEDWKGHELDRFGDLWLDDHFTVTKADQPREYHVFLFEKMMLCCKEVMPERKKSSKNSSMLRKDKTISKSMEKKKLALKGRIFVSNINRAALLPPEPSPSDPYGVSRVCIAWTVPHRHPNGWHEDQEDSFIMIGRSEEQMKKWADKVTELATAERKKQEANRNSRSAMSSGRYSGSEKAYQHSSFAPPTPSAEKPPFSFPPPLPGQGSQFPSAEDDDEDGLISGRTTPSLSNHGHAQGNTSPYTSVHPTTGRRVQSQQSMPAAMQAEFRARALTEDQYGPSMTQWRSQQQPMPPPLPRLTSAMSTLSTASEASFGPGVGSGSRYYPHPAMSRTMSGAGSRILQRADEAEEDSPTEQREAFNRYGPARGMARAPSHGVAPTVPYPPQLRNRSASSPNVYQQPQMASNSVLPPLPPNQYQQQQQQNWNTSMDPQQSMSSSSTLVGGTAYFTKRMSAGGKRSSVESHSTETSETTSDQQSPATPYGSVPGAPVSRQNSSDVVGTGSSSVLIKLRCGEDQFLIGVPSDINFPTLYQKIQKKIRLCSSSRNIGETLQIKWIDADEDEVTIKCDDDIQAMIGECVEVGASHVNLVAR
ncbi:cell division control protein 24 [Kwoniella mangroviensis CBS 10435]|uniref:Cell division control protein 24 n=1 Tax=Kwoniella mangroviensis CBS 10435 TaxID=1331196 RepID=A0A1B9J055_9TREE|nr:cell division control protein 24 [Kwoniella mangroviensis CBS 10435]